MAIKNWQTTLPLLKQSATRAAKTIIDGGHLYVGGTQISFVNEALGRSGGLILSEPLKPDTQLKSNDVVLLAESQKNEHPILLNLIKNITKSGAQIVLFSNENIQTLKTVNTFSVTKSENQANSSVTSVSNVIGMWAWTGEFVNASIRMGKMPCMYESLMMPGGRARDNVFKKIRFHDRNVVLSEGAPNFANLYLISLSKALIQLKEKNREAFSKATKLMQFTHAQQKSVVLMQISHMLPSETKSGFVPFWIIPAPEKYVPTGKDLVIFIGYQWFPWEIPQLTGKERISSIITSSRHPLPDWVQDEHHIYIDPCWEIQDSVVEVPGYDVRILPISGIIQSAIFWELIEKSAKL